MKKSVGDRWKEHFAAMAKSTLVIEDNDDDEEEEPVVEVEIRTTPDKKPLSREKKDAKIKRMLAELIERRKIEAEIKRRATTINQVDGSQYIIRDGAIEQYIKRSLLATDNPLHINQIISSIEGLGWITSSKYHKYAFVNKALRKNNYMFQPLGDGMFRLRDAFRATVVEKPAEVIKVVPKDPATLLTLRDITIDIARTYQEDNGIYPSRVHYIMSRIGYRCSYSGVYRVMQHPPFVKNGFNYKLAEQ